MRGAFCLVVAAAAVAVSGLPSSAATKRCGVASSKALYESASVQVYRVRRDRYVVDWIACRKSDRRGVVTDSDASDGIGTSETVGHASILEDRYVWTSNHGSYSESNDSQVDSLTDVQTGKTITAKVIDESDGGQSIAVPGALLFAGDVEYESRLVARRFGAPTLTLDTGIISAFAWGGATVYWLNGDMPKSAPLPLGGPPPAARAAAVRPATPALASARRRTCERRGARTVLRATRLLVSRRQGALSACTTPRGRQTRLTRALAGFRATGQPTDLQPLGSRFVFYRMPGTSQDGQTGVALVILDGSTGRVVRSAVAPTVTAAVAAGSKILYTDGSSLRVADAAGDRQIAAGVIADPAIAENLRLYWTDSGQPMTLAPPPKPGS